MVYAVFFCFFLFVLLLLLLLLLSLSLFYFGVSSLPFLSLFGRRLGMV